MCTSQIKYIYTQLGTQVVFKTSVIEMDIYIDLG